VVLLSITVACEEGPVSEVPAVEAQIITYHMRADGKLGRVERPQRLNEDAPVTIRVVGADGTVLRETSSGTTTIREGRRELKESRLRSGGRFSPDVAEKLQKFRQERPAAYEALVRSMGFPEDPSVDAFDFSAIDKLQKDR